MALRIRKAWAELAGGDPGSAYATLSPLAPSTDAERAAHLVAKAAAAWFQGDVEEAREAAAEAQPLAIACGLEREARVAIQIQVMVAHSSGDWSSTLNEDLEASLNAPDLADTLFDGHLCVGEYVLASGDPHDRIRSIAAGLHDRAVRTGARRAQVFAATILGEVALAAARADVAEERLREATKLSRELGAVSAEALASVRLGEALRAGGKLSEGDEVLSEGVVMSHWSPLIGHLQPLAYAAQLKASGPEVARERLDAAEIHVRGEDLMCAFCGMSFRIAATIAAARAEVPERADPYLAGAEATIGLYQAGPWPAALEEARGELALARGDRAEAQARFASAGEGFVHSGWRRDAQRVEARLVEIA
jgi:hypothetical protein